MKRYKKTQKTLPLTMKAWTEFELGEIGVFVEYIGDSMTNYWFATKISHNKAMMYRTQRRTTMYLTGGRFDREVENVVPEPYVFWGYHASVTFDEEMATYKLTCLDIFLEAYFMEPWNPNKSYYV